MEANSGEPQQEAQEPPRRVPHAISFQRKNCRYHSLVAPSAIKEPAAPIPIGEIKLGDHTEESKEAQYEHPRCEQLIREQPRAAAAEGVGSLGSIEDGGTDCTRRLIAHDRPEPAVIIHQPKRHHFLGTGAARSALRVPRSSHAAACRVNPEPVSVEEADVAAAR